MRCSQMPLLTARSSLTPVVTYLIILICESYFYALARQGKTCTNIGDEPRDWMNTFLRTCTVFLYTNVRVGVRVCVCVCVCVCGCVYMYVYTHATLEMNN